MRLLTCSTENPKVLPVGQIWQHLLMTGTSLTHGGGSHTLLQSVHFPQLQLNNKNNN